jgi:hypothetical protein
MATKNHKESLLPDDVCVAPIGARKIIAEATDAFRAFSWLTALEASR